MEAQKTWFITGASKGFGFEITKAALEAGEAAVDAAAAPRRRKRRRARRISASARAASRECCSHIQRTRTICCSRVKWLVRKT